MRLLFALEKVLLVDTDGNVVQDGVLLFTARSRALGWEDVSVSYDYIIELVASTEKGAFAAYDYSAG